MLFALKNPFPSLDASPEEIQRYIASAHKKNIVMFSVIILNLGQLFKWFFRKSALKQELFLTLVTMAIFIITYFLVK